jgi:starch phosphorylase
VESLYTLLEEEVVPEFYSRDAEHLPSKWLERVRESMATLTPEFAASRAIREYTNDHYVPAAVGYRARSADDGRLGNQLLLWRQSLAAGWVALQVKEVAVETRDGQHRFEITVAPGELHPDQFRVELFAGPAGETDAKTEILPACASSPQSSGTILYSVCCSAARPAPDYTVRIVPSHNSALVPLEADQILWQR